MKTFFPIAVAFVLSPPVAVHVQAVDEKDSYGDYLHGKNGYNPGWEFQKKKQLNDAYNKKLQEMEKEEKAKKAARAASAPKSKKGKSSCLGCF
ncbi:hypothetical protein DFJ73DRAFT_881000 [Zopfochytrium polystomum]|nr:hypothetical protein DFJ73DRAFT_881000 [Zopfochytrium polystomum]